jgi:hypothetical protein
VLGHISILVIDGNLEQAKFMLWKVN